MGGLGTCAHMDLLDDREETDKPITSFFSLIFSSAKWLDALQSLKDRVSL
jgi:hypothetical protein